jgi:hypothetical protein
MKSDNGEKIPKTEDLAKKHESLQKDYSDAIKEAEAEKTGKNLWKIITFLILILCLFYAKTKTVWVPDPKDGEMKVYHSDWWGIKKQTFYPVWIKPSGVEGRDSESWCTQYPDGTWRVFLAGDGESFHYQWPPKNYSSPPKK